MEAAINPKLKGNFHCLSNPANVQMVKTFFVAWILFSLVYGFGRADETMLKVVFRQQAPDVPVDSFAAKPKTLYQWGKTKGRIEETPDPAQRLTGLIIANGRDGWIINLWNHTGRHFIDHGPTHNFYAPIVPNQQPNMPPPVRDFRIGNELAFMKSHPGSLKGDGLNDQKMYECTQQGYMLRLYVYPTGTPAASEVWKDGKFVLRLIYDEYKTSLPADPSLFQPPTDVRISEG
jgi:hypothetical protein